MRRALTTPAIAALAILTLAACGGTETQEKDSGGGDASGKFPITVTDARGELDIDEKPERIVSLSPTLTETLFAVGAGDQVVAADEHSTYPEEAPDTDLSGFTPSVEAITEHDPDLVILGRDAQDSAKQLEEVNIPVFVAPAAETFDDAYEQVRRVGKATGHADKGDMVASEMKSDIDDTIAETTDAIGDTDLTYYHELDQEMYSVTSETFIGQVYSEFGLDNVADAADDTADGYPQLSAEYLVEQNPDLIFLGYSGEEAVPEVKQRPAFDTVTAVENDDITQLDPDISSRWGPRITELADSVSESVLVAADAKEE